MPQTDRWFVDLVAVLLGGYFLWSLRKVLTDFTEEIKELKTYIGKLFDKNDDHEKRLSTLEGVCGNARKNGGC